MKEVTVYNLRGNVQSIKHTLNNIALMQKGTEAYAIGVDAEDNVVWQVFPGQSADYMSLISFKDIKMVEVGYNFPQMGNPMVHVYTDSQVMLDRFLDNEDEVTILGNATKLYVRGYAEQKAEAEDFEDYMEAKEVFGGEDVVIIREREYCYTFGADAASLALAAGLIIEKSRVFGMREVFFPTAKLDEILLRVKRNHCIARVYYK